MSGLDLLAGDAQTFIEKVWATSVHIHHGDPRELMALLSIDDVDHLLTSTAIRVPSVRMVRDGSILAASAYTRSATTAGVAMTGLVDARKLFALFDDGATVVLQGLQRYWPPLSGLVRDLEVELGHPCQANAYLTPPGSRGFDLHSDTHDVFVVQTHGVKTWEVHGQDGVRDEVMAPGTSMYMPTGTPHRANTQEQASLHVTIGLNQVSWRQLVDRVVAKVVVEQGLEDQRLPAGYPHDVAGLAAGLADWLTALADGLRGADATELAQREIERFWTSRPALVRGGLSDRLGLSEVDDQTRLRRRPGSICVLRSEDVKLRVLLGDRELAVPVWLHDAVAHVRDHDELQPVDLARWLDPESRLVLVRRLVVEGLLEVVA